MDAISILMRAAAACSAAAAVSVPSAVSADAVATITLRNPSAFLRADELIRIEKPAFARDAAAHLWVIDGKCRRPVQWTAASTPGSRALVFTVDLGSRETKRVHIAGDAAGIPECGDSYPARATLVERQANGSREAVARTIVPERHQPGGGIYGFEGIGWESDKVGYRIYLDFRNAIDVFGKRKPAPVLTQLALSGVGYHAMADWGMDLLKVADSLGVGTIGGVVDGQVVRFDRYTGHEARVADDGPVLAAAEVSFAGWQVGAVTTDIRSRYEISAGSALTHALVQVSDPRITLVTGIARSAAAKRYTPVKARKWRYVASCGVQSLVPDNLGLAVLFRAADHVDDIDDERSDAVALRPASSGELAYYFLASWEQDSGWAGSCRSFHEHIEKTAERLSTPVVVSVSGN